MDIHRAVRAEGLSKAFDGLLALSEVTLAVERSEIVGLIGPNGSGKTTFINLLSGVLPPSGGSISLNAVDVSGWSAAQIARAGIGRTFQNIRLFRALSVRENIYVGALTRGAPASKAQESVKQVLRLFELGHLASQRAGTLPYGAQRRVEIARALAAQPEFLLLDEPAAGMNDSESDELLERIGWIREQWGVGLLVVDHDLRLILRLCDRIVVLNEGRLIAQGDGEAVQRDPVVAEAYLGRRHQRGAATIQCDRAAKEG